MRSVSLRQRALACLVALAPFALFACGDDDDSAASGPRTDGGDVAAADLAEADDGCAGTALEFTNLETGASGTATAALATSELEGGTYVAHAADFDIDEDDLGSWRPEVPEDGNVITVQLTVFNASEDPAPLESGSTLRWTSEPDELTFAVRHFTADEDWSHAVAVGGDDDLGELTVTGVGDTFCFEIDYEDQEKAVSGTVEAPVFEER